MTRFPTHYPDRIQRVQYDARTDVRQPVGPPITDSRDIFDHLCLGWDIVSANGGGWEDTHLIVAQDEYGERTRYYHATLPDPFAAATPWTAEQSAEWTEDRARLETQP